jgi:protein TonB
MHVRWPEFMAGMDPSSRSFTLALGASILLHAVALSIHFKLPDIIRDKYGSLPLEVVLVNSKTKASPVDAEVQAQANLDGGGNTDEDRRAKTPLPPSPNSREGRALIEAQRRVAELEAQQQQMMTRLKSEKSVIADTAQSNPTPAAEPTRSGADLASSALAIARIEGQIARQLEEYNQRPRKKFIGARVEEYRFAQYVEDWRQKIERIGNLNYPEAAKGRLYGSRC